MCSCHGLAKGLREENQGSSKHYPCLTPFSLAHRGCSSCGMGPHPCRSSRKSSLMSWTNIATAPPHTSPSLTGRCPCLQLPCLSVDIDCSWEQLCRPWTLWVRSSILAVTSHIYTCSFPWLLLQKPGWLAAQKTEMAPKVLSPDCPLASRCMHTQSHAHTVACTHTYTR